MFGNIIILPNWPWSLIITNQVLHMYRWTFSIFIYRTQNCWNIVCCRSLSFSSWLPYDISLLYMECNSHICIVYMCVYANIFCIVYLQSFSLLIISSQHYSELCLLKYALTVLWEFGLAHYRGITCLFLFYLWIWTIFNLKGIKKITIKCLHSFPLWGNK